MTDPTPTRRADDQYDPAKLLTWSALLFVAMLLIFVCAIIGWQVYLKGTADTEYWAALTGLIGWSTAKVGDVFNSRYGTSKASDSKDVTIAQQARTAAVAQNALLDPNVTLNVAPPVVPEVPPKGDTP